MTSRDESRDEPQVRVVDRRWWARQDSGEPAAEPPPLKPTYVEELERDLTTARTRLQEALAEHRRALAEFEQVKGRIRRDVEREVERGRRTVSLDLLEVLDNLERALAAARESPDASQPAVGALARGVELVRDQFLARLAAQRVARMEAAGSPFDATRHEAAATAPVDDPDDAGRVVAVLRDGYLVGDDVLRPASVVVGRYGKEE
jgi:molecular chaperone GrpE